MTLDTTLSAGQSGHLADHEALAQLYNGALADRGIVYVHPDGSDGNVGRSWTLPKATIAGAQATAGAEALIQLGQGLFDIDETIELQDGQYIAGLNPHLNFGTVLRATASLGTDPIFVNTAGNLTSGGLRHLQLRGTADANGGVGIHLAIGSTIADHWILDDILVSGMTSHGIFFDTPTGVAGNPLWVGFINAFSNGKGGTGDGVRIERPYRGVVRFAHLGGDDNAGSLLYIDSLNSEGYVRIDNLKSERQVDGCHDNVVTVNNANSGTLSIGGFRVYHNVSGGTDGNSLIRNTGDTSLRWYVDHTYLTTSGSNTYTYGFNDGATTVSLSDFVARPWVWNQRGTGFFGNGGIMAGAGTPESVFSRPPGWIYADTTNGVVYVKSSGSGNTGWAALAEV